VCCEGKWLFYGLSNAGVEGEEGRWEMQMFSPGKWKGPKGEGFHRQTEGGKKSAAEMDLKRGKKMREKQKKAGKAGLREGGDLDQRYEKGGIAQKRVAEGKGAQKAGKTPNGGESPDTRRARGG